LIRYQFMPGWRFGLRTERLNPGRPDFGLNAGVVGANSYAAGLALSALFDLPSGPVIVCTLSVIALLAALGLRVR
jgi:hypothetical protein